VRAKLAASQLAPALPARQGAAAAAAQPSHAALKAALPTVGRAAAASSQPAAHAASPAVAAAPARDAAVCSRPGSRIATTWLSTVVSGRRAHAAAAVDTSAPARELRAPRRDGHAGQAARHRRRRPPGRLVERR